MKKIILTSGGLDSSALLLRNKQDPSTLALFFNYGQRCVAQERAAVKNICQQLNISFEERDITDIFRSSKSSIINNTPLEEEKNNEVECRNLVFVMNTVSIAQQLFPEEQVEIILGLIKIGIPYPDCTKAFIEKCNSLANLCTGGKVSVTAPFIDFGKDKIVAFFKDTDILPSDTWSCYYGVNKPCGKCPACIDRTILGVL